MHFLDASAVLELLYATEKGTKIRETVQGKPIFLSTLTVHELMVGLKKKEIETIKDFLREASVVDFDIQAAFASAQIERELRQRGTMINKVDILIAGICMSRDATLVACDGDFDVISGLKFTCI